MRVFLAAVLFGSPLLPRTDQNRPVGRPRFLTLVTLFLLWSNLAHSETPSETSCAGTGSVPGLKTFYSQGWGIDLKNTRFQSPKMTSINASNVSELNLKWAYGFANDSPRSYPLVTEDTIFIGDTGRGVVALDRETGCVRWTFAHKGDVTSAILHAVTEEGVTLYFVDRYLGVFAIDAISGALKWKSMPVGPGNPIPLFTGTPLLHGHDLYVPISSMESALPALPFYGCCTTSGAIAKLDAQDGRLIWYRKTIEANPIQTGRHFFFVEEWGPSGAPVWSAPTLDLERRSLYFGTGNNYSHPTSDTSDAIFSLDADTGTVNWVRQFTSGDATNLACLIPGSWYPNCPRPTGPDSDFGAPPILAETADGRDILLVGQKSGGLFALRPDDGELVWGQKIGQAGPLGGIHFGLAVHPDKSLLFVPVYYRNFSGPASDSSERRPSIFAFDIETGDQRWTYMRASRCSSPRCWGGISAAITVTDDLIFIGGFDGILEALDMGTGDVLWQFDTLKEIGREDGTVNGTAKGGTIDAHGPFVADDLLIISSGYRFSAQIPGNALLVFELGEGD